MAGVTTAVAAHSVATAAHGLFFYFFSVVMAVAAHLITMDAAVDATTITETTQTMVVAATNI